MICLKVAKQGSPPAENQWMFHTPVVSNASGPRQIFRPNEQDALSRPESFSQWLIDRGLPFNHNIHNLIPSGKLTYIDPGRYIQGLEDEFNHENQAIFRVYVNLPEGSRSYSKPDSLCFLDILRPNHRILTSQSSLKIMMAPESPESSRTWFQSCLISSPVHIKDTP